MAGREFDLALLKELTEQDEDKLVELLENVLATRLVEEVEGVVGRYRFSHGLIRDTLTADLSTTRRVRLHGRIGEALELVYGRDAERHAPELAYHFEQASALSGAQEKAVRYSVLAAKAAETNHAYEEAIGHYQNALSIIRDTGQDPSTGSGQASSSGTGLVLGQDEILLLRGLATALRFANRVAEALRTFRGAFHLARERGDGQLAAELALEQVQTGFVPFDLSVRTLTVGLESVPDLESELAAMMHAQIASPLRGLNRPDEADENLQKAQELVAVQGYREVELELATRSFDLAYTRMEFDKLAELEIRLEQIEAEVGHASRAWGVGLTRAYWHIVLGDLFKGRQKAEHLLEDALRTRNDLVKESLQRPLATIHYLRGEFSAIPDLLKLDEPRATDEFMEMARAWVAEAKGDLDSARAAVEAAIDASTRLRILASLPRERIWLAGVERRAGNGEQARVLYDEALRELDSLPAGPPLAPLAVSTQLALEAPARGDSGVMGRCRKVLEPHEQLITISRGIVTPLLVGRALGVMACCEGRWEEAMGYLERGEAFCEVKGLVVELAHCRLALADALMHRNHATGEPVDESPISNEDHKRAAGLCAQALADYQRLGMPLYVQDALARREILRA